MNKITSLDRFMRNVEKTNSCWLWTASLHSGGYGQFRDGRKWSAHRWSYHHLVNPIPDGMLVLHHCDNPACVNPDHLFLGTQQDNMDDMRRKGRQRVAFGEDHGNVKLTKRDVWDIRHRYVMGGVSQRDLAREYGVNQSSISRIVCRERWSI